MNALPPPLTPQDCELRGLPYMPLDVVRLLDSDLFALSTGEEFKAALALWARSWSQVPAASIPDDERVQARLVGVSLAEWRQLAPVSLRGWVKCSDGRLYHPVVAEKALSAWLDRLAYRKRSAAGHAKRYARAFDPGSFDEAAERALAMLRNLAPTIASACGNLPEAAEMAATSSPEPAGKQPKTLRRERERDTSLRTDKPSAEDPSKEAWSRAVALLTKNGRLKDSAARSFFGKLLSTNGIEARDLLTSIIAAELNGTQEPQPYLTVAARGVAQRGKGRPAIDSTDWGDAEWGTAVNLWKADGSWSATLGPEPGQPSCRVPRHLLMEGAAA